VLSVVKPSPRGPSLNGFTTAQWLPRCGKADAWPGSFIFLALPMVALPGLALPVEGCKSAIMPLSYMKLTLI
jgi:hypothetical protein